MKRARNELDRMRRSKGRDVKPVVCACALFLSVPLWAHADAKRDEPPDPIIERVRRAAWVKAIPDRLADTLVEKHLYREGPVWGLAKRVPDQSLAYDEIGSATFLGHVNAYDLYDKVGGLSDAERQKALKFWQRWQDPKTGRFKDPRDPERVVNEKYVVSLLHGLGGKPLYPWTTTGTHKIVETGEFLARTKSDPDWARGGWGVGSHTGLMAVEILRAINEGRPELIPDLERGMNSILRHQDPATGLWGEPGADLTNRIGGNLKVIGRFYFRMGTRVPHTKELADTLIENQRNGQWRVHGGNACVPRNVAECMAYCIEVSEYRRADLLDAMEGLAKDYQRWGKPDGSLLMRRDDPDSVGVEYVTMYGLGILGGYLHWEDCPLPNPLAGRDRGNSMRYRPVLQPDDTIRIVDVGGGTDRPGAASRPVAASSPARR
jgi:hypothetical protein